MKFENTEVFNFEGAFRGLRNPKDSWNKSDSKWVTQYSGGIFNTEQDVYTLGKNDIDLAQRMIKGGHTHSKFLRQIFISVDITAPRYWWSEYDTYKISTTANSCSTMHKLTAYPITDKMFCFDGINDLDLENNLDDELINCKVNDWINDTLDLLEYIRLIGKETKQFKYKRIMKQMLPEGFYQKRTVTLNYENVRNMVGSRTHHLLSEWNDDFIKWAKTLPYAEELIFTNLKYE